MKSKTRRTERESIVKLSKSPDFISKRWRHKKKKERNTPSVVRLVKPARPVISPRFPASRRCSDLKHGRSRLTFAEEARGDFTVVKQQHSSVHVFIHISVFPLCPHLSHASVHLSSWHYNINPSPPAALNAYCRDLASRLFRSKCS